MKALVLAPFSPAALRSLARLMPVAYESWTRTKRLYDPEELGRRMGEEGVTALIVEADFIFEEVFDQAKDLMFLGVCRADLGHVDLEAATRHGVPVSHTPGRNAQAVAELTVGLMLSLARRIPALNGYVKQGRWEDPVDGYVNHRGVELKGSVLGLVGLGAVGRAVATLAAGFGMTVIAYDPYAGKPGQRRGGATLTTLERVLKESAFLSLHAPSTPETAGLIGERELGVMGRGTYLVNTASHDLVDEAALVKALAAGHLSGAALDVHETHPISPASPLLKLENVLLTPHVGGATEETVQRHSAMILEDLERCLRGERPLRLANPRVWDGLEG